MRVILIVDVVFLGSLLVGGFSMLLSSSYWRFWLLRICAALGVLTAFVWIADASGLIHLPRPHEAPAVISTLPEHTAVPAAKSAPVIHSKVQHQTILEDRKQIQDSTLKKTP